MREKCSLRTRLGLGCDLECKTALSNYVLRSLVFGSSGPRVLGPRVPGSSGPLFIATPDNIVTVTNTYLSRALWFSIFRCCLFVVLPLTVIVVLVLVAVVTGVAVHFAQSGEKGAQSQGR